MKRITVVIFFFLFIAIISFSQTDCIKGIIINKHNGEKIGYAQIEIVETKSGVTSNKDGFFELFNLNNSHRIEISHLSYESLIIPVALFKNDTTIIELSEKNIVTNEILVRGVVKKEDIKTMPGKERLSQQLIINQTSFMGQPDIVRSLQVMSGVQSVSEGVGDIFVRGGGPGQNLILVDDMELMNPVHLMGVYSIFNPFTVNSVDLFKGYAPVSYGSRLSSVISIISENPLQNENEFDVLVGNVASSINGMIKSKDEKWGFLFSARRSMLELYGSISSMFLSDEEGFFDLSDYNFYDVSGRLIYQLNEKNNFALNWYLGSDHFGLDNPRIDYFATTDFGNKAVLASWNRWINSSIKLNINAGATQVWSGFDGLLFNTDIKFDTEHIRYYSNVSLAGAYKNHAYSLGGKATIYNTIPQNMYMRTESDTTKFYGDLKNNEIEFFVEDNININEKLTFYVGGRLHLYSTVGPYKFNDEVGRNIELENGEQTRYEPYFSFASSLSYKLNRKSDLKLGFSRNIQTVHLANISSIPLPNDIWMMSTPILKPQIGIQGSLGYYRESSLFNYFFEVFAKKLSNQTIFNVDVDKENESSYSPSLNIDFVDDNIYYEDHFFVGSGRVYGAEFGINKVFGDITGGINYTLMKSERSFSNVFDGEWFPDKFDRRHDLSATLNYKINKKWESSALFIYATGNTITLPAGRMWIMGTIMNDYAGLNNFRMPPYHRLDWAINYNITTKYFKKSTLSFSVSNVYNRANPYFIFFKIYKGDSLYDLDVEAAQVSLFPILPSLSWRVKF